MSRWFRFYSEALDDPKVQKLDGDTFKAWVNLLCLATRHGGFLPSIEDMSFALRMSLSDANTVVERLLNATLIDKVSGGPSGYRYAPHGWDERQYKSDTSTDRVKRFRKRSKPVTETAPESETETEENSPPSPPRGNRERALIPENWEVPSVSDLPPKSRACAEQWTPESYATHAEAFVLYWRSERKMKADWRGTWANRVISLHSQVMRDQKFGNAPPAAKSQASVKTAADWEELAQWYERHDRHDDAAESRRKAKAVPIGQVIPFIDKRAQAGVTQ